MEDLMKHAYQRIVFALLIAAAPLAVAAQEAFTVRDVDVFAGPSSEYPPVAALPPGTPVRLAGCLSDWSWCDVFFANDRGWVYAGDLAYSYQNNRVVILEYGPRLALPVVTFSLDSYWSAHYRARPFFRERAQWVSRVHIQANRGGAPPHSGTAQAAQPAQQAAPAQQPREQVTRRQQPAQPQGAQIERERRDREQAARPTPQPQAKESTRPQEQTARPAQRAPQPEASVTQQPEQRARAPEQKPSQAMQHEQPSPQPQAGRPPEATRAGPEAQRQSEAKGQPERERPKEERREGNQQ
jgi:uncharacterized protein YraI